jgi:hypothetical protein
LGPSYAHPNAACHQNVRAREHIYTGSDHADPKAAAFCDADRCLGNSHRYGDECAADCDTYTLGHADSDECAADCDTYALGHADGDKCAANSHLYALGHADGDECAADCHRDSHADANEHTDTGAAPALTNAVCGQWRRFLEEFSLHGFVCISHQAF